MSKAINYKNSKDLIHFLENRLIPDLIESGQDCTVDDFKDCIYHIKKLEKKVKQLEKKLEK